MLKPTRILVPTDFSKHADWAIREAFGIAREYKAEVCVLHVVDEKIGSLQHDYSDVSVSHIAVRRRQRRLLRLARIKLDKQVERLAPPEGIKVMREVVLGIPYEEIIRFQTDKGIDLVVISSLGTTGLAKYFIGGVARNVLKSTTCPVLLTKGNGVD